MKIGNITSKFINRISPKPKVSLNEKIFSQGLNSDVFEKSEKKDLLEEIQEKRPYFSCFILRFIIEKLF